MKKIGLIREGKIPADNRVALTPAQCKWIHKTYPDIKVVAEASPGRCFSDREYEMAGVEIRTDIHDCGCFFFVCEKKQ